MQKILHIAECFGSGVLNYIKNLSTWQSKDYEVYVAYGIRPETPENFRDQFDFGIRFIEVDGFTREIELRNDLKAFLFIKKLVKEIQPDLIHLHSTKAGVLGRWAINCQKYQVLYSPHAYSFLMMDCSPLKRKFYKRIEKLSDKKGCLTIADTDGELTASRQVTSNAICIPNGINTVEMDEIIRQANTVRQHGFMKTICTLGKIVEQKNPGLFNEIAECFPDINFLWIGAGPLETKLTSSNIKITGWLSRTEAAAKVMQSDIFLFPSSWESLSIALLEVMYMGKPCVVSNADGNRDVIRSGENGFVCNNKEEYIDAITCILDNENMAREMGEKARRDVVEKYNMSAMKQKYRALFTKFDIRQ